MECKIIWFAMADAEGGLSALISDGWCPKWFNEECSADTGTVGLRVVLERKAAEKKAE